MRTAFVLAAALAVASCASSGSSERGEYSASLGPGDPPPTDERTFSCPRGMSDCRSQARDYCGEAGYRRVMTPGHTGPSQQNVGMGTIGQTGLPGREQVRERSGADNPENRTLTVRCKQPREESEE